MQKFKIKAVMWFVIFLTICLPHCVQNDGNCLAKIYVILTDFCLERRNFVILLIDTLMWPSCGCWLLCNSFYVYLCLLLIGMLFMLLLQNKVLGQCLKYQVHSHEKCIAHEEHKINHFFSPFSILCTYFWFILRLFVNFLYL